MNVGVMFVFGFELFPFRSIFYTSKTNQPISVKLGKAVTSMSMGRHIDINATAQTFINRMIITLVLINILQKKQSFALIQHEV